MGERPIGDAADDLSRIRDHDLPAEIVHHERSRELLDIIGQAMLRSDGGEWRKMTLDVSGAANMVETELTIEQTDGTLNTGAALDHLGSRACGQLRDAMYQEGKGTWYNAQFVVDQSGKIDASFDYDNPPFGGVINEDDPEESEGDADPELLLEDQRLYPRDDDVLPSWHPARSTRDW